MKSLETLKTSIIDRCFLSPRIRDHLKGKDIEPKVLSALILSSPLSLDEKHSIFLELSEGSDPQSMSTFLMCAQKIDDVLLDLALPADGDSAPSSVKLMSAEHLLSLVDDALEYARAEEGHECEREHKKENEDEHEHEHWITFASANEEIKVAEDDQDALRDILIDALPAAEGSGDDEIPIVVSLDGKAVYVLGKELSVLVFGEDDSTLFELQSLFVGLFQPGTILELDFRPFYKKRYGIVLEAARIMKDSVSEEDYVQSERVLANTPDGWECGELAWRDDLFKCFDPISSYINSYSQVRELNAEEASSLCAKRVTRDLSLILKIQDYIDQEPKLAAAITELMRSRDYDGLSGMSDDELLEFCKGTLENLHRVDRS